MRGEMVNRLVLLLKMSIIIAVCFCYDIPSVQAIPTLNTPSNGAYVDGSQINASWSAINGYTCIYFPKICSDSNCNNRIYIPDGTYATSEVFYPNLTNNGTLYYWKVDATCIDGGANWYSYESSVNLFTTYDSATDITTTASPASPVYEGDVVSLAAQGTGAPLQDYLYRFVEHKYVNTNYTDTREISAPSTTSNFSWTAPAYAANTSYALSIEVGTNSKKAVNGAFTWDALDSYNYEVHQAPDPVITTTSLPEAIISKYYTTDAIIATGGVKPYTWANINSGQATNYVFSGITIDPNTGVISGTPDGWNENFPLTIQVTDARNVKATKDLVLVVHPSPYIVESSSLPNGTVGCTYNNNQPIVLTAQGGNGIYAWSASNLPSWLSFNSSTHSINVTGTPQSSGAYTFSVQVTSMGVNYSQSFSININSTIYINTASLPDGQYNKPYSQYLSASNGTGTYTWSLQGGATLPGLSLSPSGLVSGTPTANGDYLFTVMAVDGVNIPAVRQISLKIVYPPPVTITTSANLPPGNTGLSYSKIITATGGNGTFTWSTTGGSLPTGISLNSLTGELYGMPTVGGDYSFTIMANDGVNPTASQSFTLKINSPLTLVTTAIGSCQYGIAYSQNMVASGGSNSFVWSMTGAPAGLSIDTSTGVISGIPNDVGQFSITVQVTDSQNSAARDSKTFSLIVKNSPTQNSQNSSIIGCENSTQVCTGSTTDVISGAVNHDQELFTTKGGMQNIAISLFYKSLPSYNGSLGVGWSHNYDIFLTIYSGGDGSIVLNTGNGDKRYYTKNGSSYDSTAGDTSVLTAVTGGYKITYRDGFSYNFNTSGKITSIADRYSNVISFYYTGNDLTAISDSTGRSATIGYDQSTTPHRILTITDPNSKVYNFSYQGTNCSNQLCRVTNPAATSGAAQGYWEYQYYADGMLMKKRDPNGYASQYSYYADKKMQTATDPNGRARTIVYPTTTGTLRTSTLTEKDGGQWLYTYDSTTGVIKQKTDPNGNLTDFYYYANGLVKAKTEPKDGATRLTTFYKYDYYGNILIETDPADISIYSPAIDIDTVDVASLASRTPPIKAARHLVYDTDLNNINNPFHYDRITNIADERGATAISTAFAYTMENGGEVVTATSTPGNYATTTSHITVTKKNPIGTINQAIDANGITTSFTYYPNSAAGCTAAAYFGLLCSVTDPAGITTTVTSYDNNGNPLVVQLKDSQGTIKLTSTQQYDALNRLTKVTKTTTTFPDNITQYGYDLAGNLISGIDAEQHETKYEYNFNRQVKKIIDAKLNETVFTYSGSELNGIDKLVAVYDANVAKNAPLASQPHTAYKYDKLGRLTDETDPLGKKIHYTYYDNGQVKEKYDATSAAPGTLLVTYSYNNRGQITDKTFTDGTYEHYTYKANGQLETAANQNIGYTYAYYDDGRLLSVTDSNTNVVRYDQYDGLGQRKGVTYLPGTADQRIIGYNYDSANRPAYIYSNAGAFTYSYDTMGRRDILTYPNYTRADWNFDDLGRLTSLVHYKNTQHHHWSGGYYYTFDPFAAYYYAHDQVGNRLAKTGTVNESYGYDELYRLTTVNAARPEAFTYDAAGNRLTGPGASDAPYQSNAVNQMTNGRKLTYGYDNRGNQNTKTVPGATDKSWTRLWDYNNRLIQEQKVKGAEVKTITYKYDPFGRRIEKRFEQTKNSVTETETTNYLYDNEDIVVEYFTTSAGTEKTFYTHGHGIDEPLAMERNGILSYYHADGLGSITNITTQSYLPFPIQSYSYDSYGMATPSSNFRNSYQYAGYIWDWETGTYHVRERTYDPMAGVFTSRDPIGMAGGINQYQYVGGNSVNAVDPWGLDAVDNIANLAAGFGDSLSFGLTKVARGYLGSDQQVNICSKSYKAGEFASFAMGASRLAYAGTLKALPMIIKAGGTELEQALAVSAARNTVKKAFRLNPWSKFRIYSPEQIISKYGANPEAIVNAATRSNTGVNMLGAEAAAGAVFNDNDW